MQFDACQPGSEVQWRSRNAYELESPKFISGLKADITSSGECQVNTWVQLKELFSPFSFNEALLLCQHSEDSWLAWIPDYGEAVVQGNREQGTGNR